MKKIILIIAAILILVPLLANAGAILDDPQIFPETGQDAYGNPATCIDTGDCSLDQGFEAFVAIAKWGLGILGSLALLFFIYGGFVWLTAGGNSNKIEKGKSILVNTVIGMVIVLSAWLIVQTILTSISDRSLQGLDSSSQVEDVCTNADEGTPCRGNLGVCVNGTCVQRCDAESNLDQAGYDCMDLQECNQNSVVRLKCFGPSNVVCCIPKE